MMVACNAGSAAVSASNDGRTRVVFLCVGDRSPSAVVAGCAFPCTDSVDRLRRTDPVLAAVVAFFGAGFPAKAGFGALALVVAADVLLALAAPGFLGVVM